MTPNPIAYIALFGFPLIVVMLFRRLPVSAALIWTILGGYLFLPEQVNVNLPILPALDKETIPALMAVVMLLTVSRHSDRRRRTPDIDDALRDEPGTPLRDVRHRHPIFLLLLAMIVVGPLITVLFNRDFVLTGVGGIYGLTLKDGYSAAISAFMGVLPFLLARRYLARPEDQIVLLRALIVGALIYTPLMLIEVRMSPQLNRWIYGFHAHSFAQHVRDGSYRPMVFLEHGLRVGIYIATAALSCAAMWRIAQRLQADDTDKPARGMTGRDARHDSAQRADHAGTITDAPALNPSRDRRKSRLRDENPVKWAVRLVWLSAILVLSKNLGATLILVVVLPMILLLGIRMQMLCAAAIAVVVLIYPVARGAGLVPTTAITELAQKINPDRASSLVFRLDNEDILLARAMIKPVVGWGGYGRNRVWDQGKDVSTTDGTWIILIGTGGWIGYLAHFSLLALPIIMALRRRSGLDQATVAICLLLAANLLDLIPNSSLTPLTWLMAGAVAGRVELTAKVKGRKRRSAGDLTAQSPNTAGLATARQDDSARFRDRPAAQAAAHQATHRQGYP